jgi:putative DNA primase/helicase
MTALGFSFDPASIAPRRHSNSADPAEAFRAYIMAKLGCAPKRIIGGGKMQRFPTSKNGRDDAGWYVFYDDEFPGGSFGDWRTGAKFPWSSYGARDLSSADRERLRAVQEERERQRALAQEAASAEARRKWEASGLGASASHPYLAGKRIGPHGVRESGRKLLIPVTDGERIISLQYIDADGGKLFHPDAPMAGGFFMLDGEPGETIVICEGFSTGATIREATGLPVAVAFNAGNLKPVANKMRELHPSARIVIAADDDAKRPGNPGLTKAQEAASAVGGIVAKPPFRREPEFDADDASDWNDFERTWGRSGAASAFEDELAEPPSAPIASRDELLVAAWLQRKLPPRDYLLGEVVCTTSRILVIGQTGVGKTLFSLDMGAAIAAGADFLGWQGRRAARVMYLDGELPAETFKERIEIIADRYGEGVDLFAYNRDVLGPDEMPPLNADAGRAWLLREIETVKPDIIFFDAIMCLLTGSMAEEESWAPIKDLVRLLSARRIAQVWLHHTGHDATKGFGTKTREWEMDTVVMLSKLDDGGEDPSAAFQLEFTKARMKAPGNYKQFATRIVRSTAEGFTSEDAPAGVKGRANSEQETIRRKFIAAYDEVADGVTPTPGFTGAPVRKVSIDAVRDWLKNRGFLEKNEKGNLTATGRSHFRRVKGQLLAKGGFAEDQDLIWRTIPHTPS